MGRELREDVRKELPEWQGIAIGLDFLFAHEKDQHPPTCSFDNWVIDSPYRLIEVRIS